MKTKFQLLFILSISLLSFQSCMKDQCQQEVSYLKHTGIFKTLEEIRIPIKMEAARALNVPGKIYFYNEFIFINEQNEGIHIFDNSIPENPSNLGFIPIPGNVDIAIRNNILYADNYMDLIAINIDNLYNPVLERRIRSAFKQFYDNGDGTFFVGYEVEEVTEMVDCGSRDHIFIDDSFDQFSPTAEAGNKANSGIGGSLARFSLYDDFLYAVDQSEIYIYDISNLVNPSSVGSQQIGWGIETLYAFGDKLFIGSQNGMIIMDASNPASPEYLSDYSHWTACDPVFVKDNYAYVTLRSGTLCNGSTLNQMDLIDISDILNPVLVKSFPMDNPQGLSIKENNLFLCEGDYGLKVFDIESPTNLGSNMINHFSNLAATDVIVLPGNRNILLVVGADGFYQFNFDNPADLQELSYIPVTRI